MIDRCRPLTGRPLIAKLAPNAADVSAIAAAAVGAGADGVTLVNTLPALVLDPVSGRPALGAGPGGLSGPALRPVGVLRHVAHHGLRIDAPILGVGGILGAA